MPTVIDALVVELGLDPTKFNKGQQEALAQFKRTQEASHRGAQNIEQDAKATASSFGNARLQLLGYLGAFLGLRGITQFIQKQTQINAETGRTAVVLDITTKQLSAWRGAAERSGGTAEGMTASISSLVSEFQRFALTGESSVLPYFRALGIDIADSNGKMRNSGDILLDLSDKFKAMNDPAKANAFGRALGLDQSVINMLLQGRVAVAALIAEQEKLGTITEKDAKASADLLRSWTGLVQAATNIGRSIMQYMTPALTSFFDKAVFGLSWWKTEEGKQKASADNERYQKDPHNKFGSPAEVDEWLRSVLGGKGGVFVPLSKMLSGEDRGSAAATPGPGSALRLKPGADAGGAAQPGLTNLARSLQSEIPGLNRFTALNDHHHAGTGSKHAQGLALDFTLNDPAQSEAAAKKIRDKLVAMGISAKVLDEYKHPSAGSTGGHIHVQFQSAAEAAKYDQMSAILKGAASVGAGAQAANADRGGRTSTSTSSSEIKIGTIVVHTQATDAQGIAGDIRGAIDREKFTQQANYGPQG